MQAFRTPVDLPDYPFSLDYSDSFLSMGSCFATQIAARLKQAKFKVVDNPFGILYHPHNIAYSFHRLLEDMEYQAEHLFEHRGIWSHFDFHSAYSSPGREESLAKMNASLERGRRTLSEASLLVITLGTAYVWWHKKEQRIVANCHKLPGQQFERRLTSIRDMAANMVGAIDAARQLNPSLRCLVTVSPIRHLRDGLIENQLSKSSLRLLAHKLCTHLPAVYYFPSYELMVDDLRDYRFYARDMIHPSAEALDYIWSHFQDAFFQNDTRALMRKVDKINRSLSHRPQYPDSAAHRRFQQQLLAQMEAIEQKHSFISFLSEKEKLLS